MDSITRTDSEPTNGSALLFRGARRTCGHSDETERVCHMDLAVHGLEGDIRNGGNVSSCYGELAAFMRSFSV